MALEPPIDDPIWPPPHWVLGPDGAPVIDAGANPDVGNPDAGVQSTMAEYSPVAGTIAGMAPTVLPPPPPPPPPAPKKIGETGAADGDELPYAGMLGNEPDWSRLAGAAAAETPAPEADAISGGADRHDDLLANVGDIRIEGTPGQERDRAFAQGVPDERAQALGEMPLDQAAGHVPEMSDEEFIRYAATRAQATKSKQAALEADAALKAEQDSADALEAHRRAVEKTQADAAKLDAEAKELAKSNGFNMSFGNVLAAVVASAIGGWASPATGGRNLALEEINKVAEAHLANQWRALEGKKASLGDQAAVERDMFREKQKLVMAGLDSSIAQISTKMQQFDPRGQVAMDARNQIAQLQAARAKVAHDAAQDAFKSNLDLAKFGLDQERHALDIAKFNAEQRKAAAAAAGGVRLQPEQFAALGLEKPPIPMTQKEWSQWAEGKKKTTDIAIAGQDLATKQRANDPNERNRELGIGDITYDDGSPVQFRSPEFAGKLADTKASADQAANLIDEMIRIRNRSGWTSDTVKSPDWQRAQGALASLLLEAKQTDQLGVLSGSDIELEMKKLTGGVDPTGARDPIPALKAGRDRMLNSLNAKIHAQAVPAPGKKLKRWEPPNLADIEEAKPLIQGKTAVEQAEGAKLGWLGQRLSFTSNEERAKAAENRVSTPTGLDPDDDQRVLEEIKTAASGKPASQQNALQRLADAINSGHQAVSLGVLGRVYERPDVLKAVMPLLKPEIAKEVERLNPGHVFRAPAPGEVLLDEHGQPVTIGATK
jgi:hypothetical protein